MKETSSFGKAADLQEQSDESDWEQQAAIFKSSDKTTGNGFGIVFENSPSNAPVDLLWKDFDGNEVVLRHNLLPNDKHKSITYFAQCFTARDVATRKLQMFEFRGDWSFFFEPLNFGVTPNGGRVSIISPEDRYFSNESSNPNPVLPMKLPDYEVGEQQVERSKSSREVIKLKVYFFNYTPEVVQLSWIDHYGNEIMKQDILPWGKHKEYTYFTYCFIARDKTTQQLRAMKFRRKCSFVFEGHDFGIIPGDSLVAITIVHCHDCTNG
jgi:hypothetical protein